MLTDIKLQEIQIFFKNSKKRDECNFPVEWCFDDFKAIFNLLFCDVILAKKCLIKIYRVDIFIVIFFIVIWVYFIYLRPSSLITPRKFVQSSFDWPTIFNLLTWCNDDFFTCIALGILDKEFRLLIWASRYLQQASALSHECLIETLPKLNSKAIADSFAVFIFLSTTLH